MFSWLHIPYFLVALGLMGIVQVNNYLDGNTTLIGAMFAIVFGGVFWSAIATYISKKMGKIK